MGIATQDAALRAHLNIDKTARRLENFLAVSTNELFACARLTGNNTVRGLSIADMCTVNTGRSRYTSIEHV